MCMYFAQKLVRMCTGRTVVVGYTKDKDNYS